jgi:hypothetical protein
MHDRDLVADKVIMNLACQTILGSAEPFPQ